MQKFIFDNMKIYTFDWGWDIIHNTLLIQYDFFCCFFKLLWVLKLSFAIGSLKRKVMGFSLFNCFLGKVVIGLLEISKGKLQRLFFNWKFEWNYGFLILICLKMKFYSVWYICEACYFLYWISLRLIQYWFYYYL